MKKQTHEEYVKKLAIKNPTVNVVDQYINASTPILHHCITHDVSWNTTPSRALLGCGCPECKKDRFIQAKRKTHQQYIEEVALINSNIVVMEKYIDACTPILHKCLIDKHTWKTLPSNILRGSGCPECRNRTLHEQRAKTQEEYEKEVETLHPKIKVRGVYVNADTPILHECLADGYRWMARPGNILSGKCCPECAGNLKMTNDEYINNLRDANPNVIALEEYINIKTPILHKCLIDNHVWKVSPACTLQGCRCPKCAGNLKKTHDEYIQALFLVNPDIEAMESYKDAKTPILHRCKRDGYEWKVAPSNILSGQGCPVCLESDGERQVRHWLEKHCVKYQYQYKFVDCKDKKELPFDFYLLDYNILIEYDGQQHFEPIDFAGKGEEWATQHFLKVQLHDNIKTQYCNSKNIRLLRIPYFENTNQMLDNYLLNIVT